MSRSYDPSGAISSPNNQKVRRSVSKWFYRYPFWAGITLAGVLGAAVFGFLNSADSAPMDLEISASFSTNACCQFEISVNDTLTRSFEISPGAAHVFRVRFEGSGIRRLRFDLGEVSQSSVIFQSISVTTPDRVERIPLTTIHTANRNGTSAAQFVEDGVLFVIENPHAGIFQDVSIPARRNPFLEWWWTSTNDVMTSVVSFGILGVTMVILAGIRIETESLFLIIAGILTVAILLIQFSLTNVDVRDSAREAVGVSTYTGIWKQRERLVYFLTGLIALGVPFLVAIPVWLSRSRQSIPFEPDVIEERKYRVSVHVGLAMVLIFLVLVPDLEKAVAATLDYIYPRDWDIENVVYWDWLVSKGSIPVRDFFFPYGFQYLFAIDLPWGSLFRLGSDLLLWFYVLAGTYLVLRRFTKGSHSRFWMVCVPLLLILFSQGLYRYTCIDESKVWLCARPERYMGGLGTILLFAGVPVGRGWHLLRVLIGLSAFHTIFLEPAQMIYAAPGIALLAAVRFWSSERGSRLKQISYDAVPIVVPLLLFLSLVAATGQLKGFVDQYFALTAVTVAASVSVPIEEWIRSPENLSGWVYWGPIIAVVMGVAEAVMTRGQRERYVVVVSVGMLGFMVLGRQITRAGGESIWWVPLLFGPIFWVAITDRFLRSGHQLMMGVLIGFVGSYLWATGTIAEVTGRIWDSPRRLVKSIATVVSDQERIRQANDRRFDESRFVHYEAYFRVVDELKRLGAQKDDVWVASDNQLMNVLTSTGTKPLYFATSYDASPLDWQKKMVAQLEKRRPSYAVLDKHEIFIDEVPYVVRVPLIRSWMVNNFVPAASTEEFEILKLRKPEEDPNISWWADKFGSTLNIGSLMAVGKLPLDSCSGDDCSSYIRIKFPRDAEIPREINVEFTVAGTAFALRGKTDPNVRTYILNLDRLWFWSLGKDFSRQINTREISGTKVEILDRRPNPDVLY